MKSYNVLFFASVWMLGMSACSSGADTNEKNAKKDTVVQQTKEDFPKGEVIETVIEKLDADQSYSLFLPSNYSTDKTFPVIYIFDAHGAGKLPVTMYKDLAEKYGYILVGSNNSKNGNTWEQSVTIFDKLYADTKNRLAINSQRIYLMGFSGGARVANAITIFNGNVAGVICQGAVAPAKNSENPRNNYTHISIAGTDDMNYNELVRYHMIDLAGHNLKNAMITFDGKHEWCPSDVMNEAFLWLELGEMRRNLKNKNEELIKTNFTPQIDALKKLMEEKKYLEAYKLCKKTINFYDGLTDLSTFFAAYKELQTKKELDIALQNEEKMLQDEEKLKQQYMQYMQSKDGAWWSREIASLNAKTKNGKSPEEKHMYKRILGYLSLVCYSQTNGFILQNNLMAAEYFARLYVLVDPTNSEADYFMATINAKRNNKKAVFDAMNKALINGFSDKARFENDTVFAKYKSSKEYENMLSMIANNTK